MNEQKSDIQIMNWEEDITLKNAGLFRTMMKEFIATENSRLVLNLEKVAYVNSAALGVIADAVIEARRNKKELVIAGIQNTVEEIFNIVKFKSFIHLFKDKSEALQFFEQK